MLKHGDADLMKRLCTRLIQQFDIIRLHEERLKDQPCAP
jgi:hypothetical protein